MQFNYFHPKFWSGWLLIALAWCIAHLPLAIQFKLGALLGRFGFVVGGRRKNIASTNIALCFPELSELQQAALVKEIFISTGISAIETAIAWFRPASRYQGRMQITGLELLEAAQQQAQGVLLVGAHFATLDMAGALLALVTKLDIIYRKNKNPQIESLMLKGRKRIYEGVIERKNTRQILTRLKQGATIWYAADQDYGIKHSVFVPFFKVNAATITATTRLAQFNHSAVLFLSHFRDPQTRTWSLHISEVPGYPSGDKVSDAILMNAMIEIEIRKHPEQYLWLHRRFKTRPEGEDRPYKK